MDSGTAPSLEARLRQEQGGLRGRAVAVAVCAVIAITALSLGLAAVVLRDGRWMSLPKPLPLLAWGIAAVASALVLRALRGRDAEVSSIRALAGTVEREQQLRSGSLRGALEVGGNGVLGARAAQDVARRLTPAVLAPQLTRRITRTLGATGTLAALAVATVFVGARTSADGLQAALHPVLAWRGLLLPPLGFDRLPASVPRGMPLVVRIEATGRRSVVVSRRASGEAWRDTTLWLDADDGGIARLALGPVRAPVTLRVADGRAPMVEATVTVADRGWIGDVALFAQYPAYLQRVNEAVEPVPPILVPRGTRVRVTANLRGGARHAYLTDGADTVRFAGDTVVSTTLVLERDGQWRWFAEASSQNGQATLPTEVPDALTFSVVPDRAPEVVIRAPMSDTTIGAKGVVPIIVQAGDDHGVGLVSLQLWRERVGATPSENVTARAARERLDVAEPAEPIFIGGVTVPLDGRDLQPGDKLHVVALATDNSPWRQQTVSAEVILRVPSLSEQRAMARDLADSLAARAAQMAQQEKRLQQNTADASRSRELKAGGTGDKSQPNSAAKPPGSESKMSFAAAEKAKQLGRDQQKLGAKVDSLRASAKELEERLKNAGALDTALQARMRDVQKMLRDAMTPEMQKQLQALEKSTERLSGTEAQQSMEQLAAQQQQMREQLDKSAEMLKRAALEGAMSTLRDDARELAKAEQQLADRLDAKKSGRTGEQGAPKPGDKPGDRGTDRAREQAQQNTPAMDPKTLAERSRELEREIDKLAKRLEEAGAKPGASKTKAAQPMVNQAAEAMQKAAQQAAEDAARESAGKPNGDKGDPGEKSPNQAKNADPKMAAGAATQSGKEGEPQKGSQKGDTKDGSPSGSEQGQSKDGQKGAPGGEQGGGSGGGEARKASEAMDNAAKQLASARESQVDAWKTELSQQLDQSINETMQLARQQSALEQKARQQGGTQGMQGEQGALQQGVQQAAERLEKAGRSSSLLSQRSQKAMADAQRRVSDATQQMGNSTQPGGSEASQQAMKDASEALNQALSSLVRDREKVNNAQSASGFTEMMEQLKQLAQQQGNLNGQMQGLNLMPGGAQGQAARNQARVLARQQREVAKSLADVSDADQTGRMDALAKEAQTLAQQMERSDIDPAVASRQQQLYRRLLDAGRFLEQDERDDQGPREAKAGSASGAKGSVDGPQSGKAANKFAPPTWNELRGLGPEERRLVIEYFRRLNGSAP